MEFTDEELLLLENLTYIDNTFRRAIGEEIYIQDYETVGEYLAQFTPEILERLKSYGDAEVDGGLASGSEWAAMIQCMQSNQNICNLRIDGQNSLMHSGGSKMNTICFVKPDGTAIVAFRGTLDANEWADNAYGLDAIDTECQKEALNYIEQLEYTDITVVGHSKGGNKAQYVGVLSDKVTYALSFDGQGFSQEFLDTYWAEIAENAGKVNCYSLSTDFVHILLYRLPGAQQNYVMAGRDVNGVAQNHSPNAFFQFTDEGLSINGVGKPEFPIKKEDPSLTMLHEFTTFVLNIADKEQKAELSAYVGGLLAQLMGGGSSDETMEYVFSDPDALAIIVAYLVKYMETYNIGGDEVLDLMEAIGLGDLVDKFNFDILGVDLGDTLGWVLDYICRVLSDGDEDKAKQWILQEILNRFTDYDIDVKGLWKKIENSYEEIGNFDKETAREDATLKTGRIMDYSKKTYDMLMETAKEFEGKNLPDVSGWKNYASEPWYSALMVEIAVRGINHYSEKLSEANLEHKKEIERIFTEVYDTDTQEAQSLQNARTSIINLYRLLSLVAESVG